MSDRLRNLHLIPGVSGSGKTTVARHLEHTIPEANVIIGYTTREPRTGEEEGVDYYFRTSQHFREVIARTDDTWRYSQVGDNYYYNSDRATLPNDASPVRILPVSFSTLHEVLDDYSLQVDNSVITVTPIIIDQTIREQWLKQMSPLRPERDLERELEQQEEALKTVSFDELFIPRWNLKEDCDRYVNVYRALINRIREVK